MKSALVHHPASFTSSGRPLAVSLICLSLLCGCSTTKTAAEASDTPSASSAADAKGILAKGGTTASNRYVDPMVSTARGQMQARSGPGSTPQTAAANTLPTEMPEGAPSIAGLTTEPTGVRAGSFSIFSSSQPPASETDSPTAETTGTVANTPGVSAARRSVFSASPAQTASPCGTDAQGTPLSC